MSQKTKSTLRLISILIVLLIVAMYFGLLPFIDVVDEFMMMIVAYALLLVTLK